MQTRLTVNTWTEVLTYLQAALAREEGCCQEARAYPVQPPRGTTVRAKLGQDALPVRFCLTCCDCSFSPWPEPR